MKVLFVASGNHGKVSPVVKAQGDSLVKAGAEEVRDVLTPYQYPWMRLPGRKSVT